MGGPELDALTSREQEPLPGAVWLSAVYLNFNVNLNYLSPPFFYLFITGEGQGVLPDKWVLENSQMPRSVMGFRRVHSTPIEEGIITI